LITVAFEIALRRGAECIEVYDLALAVDRWAIPQGLRGTTASDVTGSQAFLGGRTPWKATLSSHGALWRVTCAGITLGARKMLRKSSLKGFSVAVGGMHRWARP
jgi:hypothetical protein